MAKVEWHKNFERDFDTKHLREWRCGKCRKLLAMEYVHSGNIAIKCVCGELNRLMFKSLAHNDTITTATPAGGKHKKLSKGA